MVETSEMTTRIRIFDLHQEDCGHSDAEGRCPHGELKLAPGDSFASTLQGTVYRNGVPVANVSVDDGLRVDVTKDRVVEITFPNLDYFIGVSGLYEALQAEFQKRYEHMKRTFVADFIIIVILSVLLVWQAWE